MRRIVAAMTKAGMQYSLTSREMAMRALTCWSLLAVTANGVLAQPEFAEMVRLGLTPLQALRAATVNAAEVLGIGRDLGSLEDVRFVMQAGRVVRER